MDKVIKYFLVCLAGLLPLFAFSQGICWKIKPVYDEIFPFNEGVAVVKSGDKYGYIDENGKLITPVSFEMAHPFRDGIGVITQKDQVISCLVDKTGRMTAPQSIYRLGKHAVSFHEGLLPVKDNTGLFGYIDKTGAIAIPCRYADAFSFYHGLAPVYYAALPVSVKEVEYLYPFSGSSEGGYINKQGLPQVKPRADKQGRYCFVSTFSDDGLAVVSDGKRYYFIDAQESGSKGLFKELGDKIGQLIKNKFKVSKQNDITVSGDKMVASYQGGFIVFNQAFQPVSAYGKNNGELMPGAPLAGQKKFKATVDAHGLVGITFMNGARVLPQFQEVIDGGEDWAIVKQNDRYGVIGLQNGLSVQMDAVQSEGVSVMGMPAPVTIGVMNKSNVPLKDVSVGMPAFTKDTAGIDVLPPGARKDVVLGLPCDAFGNSQMGVSEVCLFADGLLIATQAFSFNISALSPLKVAFPQKQAAYAGKNTLALTVSNTEEVAVPEGLIVRVSDHGGEIFAETLAAMEPKESRKLKIPFTVKKSGEVAFTVTFWYNGKCVSTQTGVVSVSLRKKKKNVVIAPI